MIVKIINFIVLISTVMIVFKTYETHAGNNKTNINLYLNKLIGYTITVEPWRARELSTTLCRMTLPKPVNNKIEYKSVIKSMAYWQTGCMAIALILLFIFFQSNFIIYAFALIISIMIGLTRMPFLCYPWDGPAVMVWTIALVLWLKKPSMLLLFLPLAMGFKETVGICCVLLLFVNKWSKRARIIYFSCCLTLCIIARQLYIWHANCHGSALQFVTGEGVPYFIRNFTLAFSTFPMVCAGLLIAIWFIKGNTPTKILVALFMIPIMLTGCIDEIRIFAELTPVIIYALTNKQEQLKLL